MGQKDVKIHLYTDTQCHLIPDLFNDDNKYHNKKQKERQKNERLKISFRFNY